MRSLAIGDIHGCSDHLGHLLDFVQPSTDDLIITLGDYVDRGPDSRGVIQRLIDLRKTLKIVCLRGNHEVMMIDARGGSRSSLSEWLSVGGRQTLDSYSTIPGQSGTFEDIPPEHWDFLEHDLLDYYETDSHIFVHAGALRDYDMDEQPEYALFWDFLPESCEHMSNKTIICGHTSQRSGEVRVIPGAVCIDTFAYGGGCLTCLDALSGRYWQVDQLGRRREGFVEYEDYGEEYE